MVLFLRNYVVTSFRHLQCNQRNGISFLSYQNLISDTKRKHIHVIVLSPIFLLVIIHTWHSNLREIVWLTLHRPQGANRKSFTIMIFIAYWFFILVFSSFIDLLTVIRYVPITFYSNPESKWYRKRFLCRCRKLEKSENEKVNDFEFFSRLTISGNSPIFFNIFYWFF